MPSATMPMRALQIGRGDALGQQHARPAVARVQRQQVATRSPSPASPAKVRGSASNDAPSRVISASPRVISAAFALSPKPSPSETPAARRDHVLRRTAQLDADQVGVGVDAQTRCRDRLLQPRREVDRLRGDDGCRRRAAGDLLRVVRPRQHRHPGRRRRAPRPRPRTGAGRWPGRAPSSATGRRPPPGRRAPAAPPRTPATESPARPVRPPRRSRRRAARPGAPSAIRTPGRYCAFSRVGLDLGRVSRVAGQQVDVVTAAGEVAGEGRAPRASADDRDAHRRSSTRRGERDGLVVPGR